MVGWNCARAGCDPISGLGRSGGGSFKGVVESSSSSENSRRPESAVSPRFCCHEIFPPPPSSYFFSLLLTHTPLLLAEKGRGREGRTRRMRSRGGGRKRKGQPKGRGKKRLPSTLPFLSLSPPPPRGKRSGGVGKTVGCRYSRTVQYFAAVYKYSK